MWLWVRRTSGPGRLSAIRRDVFLPSLLSSLPAPSPSSLRIDESCRSSVGPRLRLVSACRSFSMRSVRIWPSVKPDKSDIWDLRGSERGSVACERPATELRGVPEDREEAEENESDPREEEWSALLLPKRRQHSAALLYSICEIWFGLQSGFLRLSSQLYSATSSWYAGYLPASCQSNKTQLKSVFLYITL